MNISRDKQLARLEIADVMKRRRFDQALNMKQFAIAAGICYSAACHWFRQPGFPTFCGVVFWSDFVMWRRAHTGLSVLTAPPDSKPPTESDRQSCTGWLRNLPPKARRIMDDLP